MVNDNLALKKPAENYKISPSGLNQEIERLNSEAAKQQETLGYMYKRTKTLSSIISQFYERHTPDQSHLDITQEYVLSFENPIKKLEKIFQHFEEMKANLGTSNDPKFANTTGYRSVPHNSYGINDQGLVVRCRSKSPSPYGRIDDQQDHANIANQEKEFMKNGSNQNRNFKKNVTHI